MAVFGGKMGQRQREPTLGWPPAVGVLFFRQNGRQSRPKSVACLDRRTRPAVVFFSGCGAGPLPEVGVWGVPNKQFFSFIKEIYFRFLLFLRFKGVPVLRHDRCQFYKKFLLRNFLNVMVCHLLPWYIWGGGRGLMELGLHFRDC